MDGQRKLEEYVKSIVHEASTVQEGMLNGLMSPVYVECSNEEGTVTLSFKILKWEINRNGILHGGITAAAFDYTMGILARFYAETNFSPTVSLDIKYIRQVELCDTLIVKAKVISKGRKVIHLTVEAVSQSTGKLAASGAGIFLVAEKRA